MTIQNTICNILLFVVSICTIISYVPQIVKILRTKKTEDISALSWIIWVVSSTSYLIYSFIIADFMLVLSSLLEFSLNITILALTIKYRQRRKINLQEEK